MMIASGVIVLNCWYAAGKGQAKILDIVLEGLGIRWP